MKSRQPDSECPSKRSSAGKPGSNGRYAMALLAVVLSVVYVVVVLDGRKSKKLPSEQKPVSLPIQISSLDVPTVREQLQQFTIPILQELELPDRPASSIVFDSSGVLLHVAAGKDALAFEYPTLNVKSGFQCHTDDIEGLAIAENGTCIATASSDQTACVWSLNDWSKVVMNPSALKRGRTLPFPTASSQLSKFDGHDGVICCVALSPSSNLAATCSADSTIAIWNCDDGELVRRLSSHNGTVLTLDFSQSGRWLATAGSDSMIRVWNVYSGALTLELSGHTGYVNQVRFAGDRTLVSGGDDNTARIWSLEDDSYRSLVAVHPDHVDAIAIDSGNDRALSLCADGFVQLHSLSEFKTTGEAKLRISYPQAAACSPNGRYLAIGNHYGELYLCDLDDMKLAGQE